MYDENDFPIRVTSYEKRVFDLSGWRDFLQGKGYKTTIVEKTDKYKTQYALFRNLSANELKDIAEGRLIVKDEFLMKAKDGIQIKEKDLWK